MSRNCTWGCTNSSIMYAPAPITGGTSAPPDAAAAVIPPATCGEKPAFRIMGMVNDPVVTALAGQGVTVSVDTMRARVAADALEAGAALVNDVSGGLADPDMGRLVAAAGVPMIVMHWRGHSADMQRRTDYSMYDGYAASPVEESGAGGIPEVVAGVAIELAARVTALRDAGVKDEQVILDPGLGFAKTAEHNWQLLAHLDHLATLGFPLLVGASRKRFLGQLLEGEPSDPAGVPDFEQRDQGTAAISLIAAQAGAWAVRVHDVPGTVTALRVAAAVREARAPRHVDGHG